MERSGAPSQALAYVADLQALAFLTRKRCENGAMLANLQRFITLGLVVAAATWATWHIRQGRPFWAAGGALLILFGYALFLAVECVLMSIVNRKDPAPRARLQQVVRAWWGEVITAPRVFCWRQPFRTNAEPDFLPASPRRGVVFVHGFVCNRAFWNPMMRRLRGVQVPFIAVNLEPVFGSIDQYSQIIEAAVRRMEDATGQPPVVVGHSMGGLALRAWLNGQPNDSRVHRVITIASPHRGTFLGHFAHSANTRQMKPGSTWLSRLESQEQRHWYGRYTCFYGHCDNVVFPASSATLPGADNRHIAASAHVQMAHDDRVFSEVLRWAGAYAAREVDSVRDRSPRHDRASVSLSD